MALTREAFETWLSDYGVAWSSLDADRYLPLFAEDVRYFWEPFEAPKRGRENLKAALNEAFHNQADPTFDASVITVDHNTGWAHWTCTFTRKGTDDPGRVDGILKAVFQDGQCAEFREWWHRLEPGQGDLMRDFDA